MIPVGQSDPAYSLRIEELGVRVYSLPELCCCILKYPLLFTDREADEAFFSFIGQGAGEPELEAELMGAAAAGSAPGDLYIRLPGASGYADGKEEAELRTEVRRLRGLPSAEYTKEKADLLFSLKKFGRAVSLYEKVLSGKAGPADDALRGRTLHNEGSAYANLFMKDRAFRCFQEAYELLKEPDILKKIYFLALTEPPGTVREHYLAAVPDGADPAWDEEYAAARERAETGAETAAVKTIFDGDPLQRVRRAAEKVRSWKNEYRTMQ